MKPIQKLYYFESDSRKELVEQINKFMEDYLLSNPNNEIANIMNSNFDSNLTKETIEDVTDKIRVSTFERVYYGVITIMENLDNDNPKRINLLS